MIVKEPIRWDIRISDNHFSILTPWFFFWIGDRSFWFDDLTLKTGIDISWNRRKTFPFDFQNEWSRIRERITLFDVRKNEKCNPS